MKQSSKLFKFIGLLLVVGLLFAALPTGQALAATICVNPGGTDGCLPSIQAAITAANVGDTINVAAGIYNLTSRIDVTKAVSIIGDVTTPSNVVINAPVAGGTQNGQNSVFMITSNDVTIRGFKIQGALHTGLVQNAGIYVDDPRLVTNPGLSNITISNNEVTNNGYGIFVHNIKNSAIANNKVFGNKKAAGTNMYRESGIGIVVYGNAVDTNHTSNLTISGNDVYDNDTEGIRVGVGDEVGPNYLALDMDITISNNNIYHNGSLITDTGFDTYIGIKSSGWSNGVTVTGNTIYNHTGATISATSGNAGIQIHASKGWSIDNNNIHDNLNGIFFANSGASGAITGSHTITSNDITNNIRGISIDKGTEAVAGKNRIYANDSTAFSGIGFAPYGVYNRGTGTFDTTNNWWGCNAGPNDAAAKCDTTTNTGTGTITSSPWLILQTLANPTSVDPSGTAAITANLRTNSANVDTSAAGYLVNGVPVSFTTTGGVVVPTSSTTLNGQATTTFTATATALRGTYEVCSIVDNQTICAIMTVGNWAPMAVDDTYVTAHDKTLSITIAFGVLANDTDPDGDVKTATLVTNVSHGTLSLYSDGSFTYTPAPRFVGTDTFVYKLVTYPALVNPALAAAVGWTDDATVTITVTPYIYYFPLIVK